MANADFSQNNKQTAPGGFDAGSYREKAKPEQTVKLTPASRSWPHWKQSCPQRFPPGRRRWL